MRRFLATFCLLLSCTVSMTAQVPQMINYQGRVAVGNVNFTGTGQFKFALVSAGGAQTYWSNDGTSVAGSEPVAAVSRPVVSGLYDVLLGDTGLTNMTAVPPAVFNNVSVWLRVWFNDGVNGSEMLTPDTRIAAVGYAMVAEGVKPGGVTSGMIAPGAVTGAHIANGGEHRSRGAHGRRWRLSSGGQHHAFCRSELGEPGGGGLLAHFENQPRAGGLVGGCAR
jgi:hypothetical protein